MDELLLCESEYRMMNVIWNHAPVESGKLVKLCEAELEWKKSTTYTILRKLCAKGLVQNEESVVSVLVPRERVQKYESERIVQKSFGGSLPAFISSFLGNGNLSKSEADELIQLIEEHRDDE
ncbi:MAG: BlaI/MecI/CopY family transcriptional regulator [Eubacteriales bacterium]|nr:BlaI/MecI/CopY family transcriptional regulator [Eubacteriales bacterium]